MAAPRCESDSLTIVLLVNFNPSIFQPRWMASVDLLGPKEAENAKLTVISADASVFEVGDWLGVQVTPDRFQATAPFAHAPAVRDLVVGLFRILEHTPVTQLGINRAMHFRLPEGASRDALAEKLAPKDVWPPQFHKPKLQSLRMQAHRPGSSADLMTTLIEPSIKITGVGVFIATGEHYAVGTVDRALAVLLSDFDESVRFGREIAEAILSFGG